MRASIVVPVYNGASTVLHCLDALATQTWPASDYEVVVVNDGSTDDTLKTIGNWHDDNPDVQLLVISQQNAGPAAARNRGAAEASAPILLFTDADCVPEPDWLERMTAAFAQDDVAGVKGAYLTDQTGRVPRFVQAEYEDRYDRMRGRSSIDFVDTYSAGYRRQLFLENGGFDPIFPTASVEDQEFSFRLAGKGYRLVFAPDARVRHLHDETVCDYARRKYYIGYWKALVTKRYPQRIVSDSHTPQVLKAQIGAVATMAPLGLLSLAAVSVGRLRWAWKLLAAVVALFLALIVPFQIKLFRRSPVIGVVAPILLIIRALALGCGYLVGTLRFGSGEPSTRNRKSED